jgi:hypothetical protein
MTDDAPPSQHEKKEQRSEESEKYSGIEKQVGVPLRELAQRIEALISEIRTQRETDHRDRQDYQQQESNRLRVDTRWNRILSVLTLVVGGLTLLVLLKTYGVYSAMNETYKSQATIMATQAASMDKQRGIAEKQTGISEQQKEIARATERAYVNVQTVEPVHKVMVGNLLEADIAYVNTGLSPASHLIVDWGDGEPPPANMWNYSPPAPQCRVNPNGEILPPHVTRHIFTNIRKQPAVRTEKEPWWFHANEQVISQELFDDIRLGRKVWEVEADIAYLDQFGGCHASREVFVYNLEANLFEPAPRGFSQTDK